MEQRSIAMVVVVALVAVILMFALLDSGILNKGNNIVVVQTTSINCSTTSSPVAATTSIMPTIPTSTVKQSYQGCLAGSAEVSVYNGNFSTGSFEGWNVTGIGFGSAPRNIIFENNNSGYYSNKWSGYNGIFFASTYSGGIILSPGNLTSMVFQVTEPYLNFQIESPENNNIYVEILKNGKPAERSYYNTVGESGKNYSIFMNASLPLSSLLCSNVSIKVVADVVSSPGTRYDFMGIGNFYLSRNQVQTHGIIVNQSFLNAS